MLPTTSGVVVVHDERLLERNFRGWKPGAIAARRAPPLVIAEDGHPVSICFCARRSDVAVAAGLETAAEFRGFGFAPPGCRLGAGGSSYRQVPLHSAACPNEALLAVARES